MSRSVGFAACNARPCWWHAWSLLALLLLTLGVPVRAEHSRVALLLDIDGPIGPATSDYLHRSLERALEQDVGLVILRIDTPGGLDTSMREIVQDILASPVAVVSYVAPSGARAAGSALDAILTMGKIDIAAPGGGVQRGMEEEPSMTYVDAMIAAVPTANKAAYLEHAKVAAAAFKEHGALSLTECWGDDVPEGEVTSLHKAVLREADETVVFSWIAWPSKAARDAGWAKLMADPRMSPETNPMPFDGKRLIYGGFEVISEA